jgi:hypothetical protein
LQSEASKRHEAAVANVPVAQLRQIMAPWQQHQMEALDSLDTAALQGKGSSVAVRQDSARESLVLSDVGWSEAGM